MNPPFNNNLEREWMQRWRPVVLLSVPGAGPNIRALPPSGATPDDLWRVAEDLRKFIDTNPGAASFKEEALTHLRDDIAIARKETDEASAAWPVEAAARDAFTEATIVANDVLVRGLEVVRAIFGPTSPEYKRFIGREKTEDEEAEERESAIGEGGGE